MSECYIYHKKIELLSKSGNFILMPILHSCSEDVHALLFVGEAMEGIDCGFLTMKLNIFSLA